MKFKFVTLLVSLLPLISACQDTKHSIVEINHVKEERLFVELKTEQLVYLLESKQQFVLETYSPYCSHCADLEKHLDKYSKEKAKVIYRYDLTTIGSEEEFVRVFQNKYPDIFPNYSVPAIRYINEGKLTYEVSSNKFASYYGLAKIMDKHFAKSKITMIGSKDEYDTYKKSNNTYLIYGYDLTNEKSLELATKYLINEEIAKTEKSIILANKSIFDVNFEDFYALFNAETSYFATLIKDNEQIKTIDYTLDDGSELSSLLSAF